MIQVNGMAHVILTVSQWEKARAFYAELLPFLGLTKVYDGNNFLYHVGGRTAIGIQRCAEGREDERFEMNELRKILQSVSGDFVVCKVEMPQMVELSNGLQCVICQAVLPNIKHFQIWLMRKQPE